MSHNLPPRDETFDEKLNRLRLRIDELPPQQRSHLSSLADAIARQHYDLEVRKRPHHVA